MSPVALGLVPRLGHYGSLLSMFGPACQRSPTSLLGGALGGDPANHHRPANPSFPPPFVIRTKMRLRRFRARR